MAIKIRFDGLPIHSNTCNHSPMYLEVPRNVIVVGANGELDPTGLQQDCLGMTPLHILACSIVQCLEAYQFMIEKYPNNLTVEDAWGALPLLYAVLGDAPCEVVKSNQPLWRVLVSSYTHLSNSFSSIISSIQ